MKLNQNIIWLYLEGRLSVGSVVELVHENWKWYKTKEN